MAIIPTPWKTFIVDHPEKESLNMNMAAVSAAFSPSKSAEELFELALGSNPSHSWCYHSK